MREMEKETKRHCRKCLTRDMDQNAYFENLHAYIRDLDEALKVEEPLYEERLSLCRKCDLLADGSYVELRAVMKKNSCPYEKWMSEKELL